MKKITLLVLSCFALLNSWAQNGDFSIELSTPSTSMLINDVVALKVHTCNNGLSGNDYVANSIRLIISVGTNVEILGINANTSDPRWKKLSLTSGPNNTIRISNAGGTMKGGECADIYLNVKGEVIGNPSIITGTIGFITAINPLLNNAPNATQGNVSTSNDNSLTSLAVAAPISNVSISVYPNPVIDKATIVGAALGSSITLYDVAGAILLQSKAAGSGLDDLDVSRLAKGTYYVRVKNNTIDVTLKIVKGSQ